MAPSRWAWGRRSGSRTRSSPPPWSAASLALQLTPLTRKSVEIPCEIQFDYTVTNDVLKALRRFNCSILRQETQLFCLYDIGIPKIHENECMRMLQDVPGLVLKKKSGSL
jgi:hypothetical protein